MQQMDKNMVTCYLILDIEKKIGLVQKDGLWIFTDIAENGFLWNVVTGIGGQTLEISTIVTDTVTNKEKLIYKATNDPTSHKIISYYFILSCILFGTS